MEPRPIIVPLAVGSICQVLPCPDIVNVTVAIFDSFRVVLSVGLLQHKFAAKSIWLPNNSILPKKPISRAVFHHIGVG